MESQFRMYVQVAYQANVVSTWQLRHHIITLRNGKKYINFEIFDCLGIDSTSQTRINACILILKKNFRIDES